MSAPDFTQLKSNMKNAWMAGDFGQIAAYSARAAAEFVERTPITPGLKLLDVACGTGNTAIPAAKAGATVTGVDIATNLLAQARQRASVEKLDIKFDEGDAEQLAYPEGAFDVVLSMFGAMFAPRPELVASELLRVCRSGGTVAMANWTPQGFVGQKFPGDCPDGAASAGPSAARALGRRKNRESALCARRVSTGSDAAQDIFRVPFSTERRGGIFPPIFWAHPSRLQPVGRKWQSGFGVRNGSVVDGAQPRQRWDDQGGSGVSGRAGSEGLGQQLQVARTIAISPQRRRAHREIICFSRRSPRSRWPIVTP